MRYPVLLLSIMALLACSNAVDEAALTHAREIIGEYLAFEIDESAEGREGRITRFEKLKELEAYPMASVRAIGEALDAELTDTHRRELLQGLSFMSGLQSREAADLLTPFLDHEDHQSRREALMGLRRMAHTVRRRGTDRLPREPMFEPAVSGLLPVLIHATHDENEGNRQIALYAVAETRDPSARDFLTTVLDDPSAPIRFTAAHLLAEFGDDTGFGELRAALDELVAEGAALSHQDGMRATRLILAFEELSGTSLGEIPMDPMLSSVMEVASGGSGVFAPLLADWQAYWVEQESAQN